MVHIREFDGKMKGLCDKKDKYVEASRSKASFSSRVSKLKSGVDMNSYFQYIVYFVSLFWS